MLAIPVCNLMHGRESRFAKLEGPVHLQFTQYSLTKKETMRDLRSSIPALQAEKRGMVNGPNSSHRKYGGAAL